MDIEAAVQRVAAAHRQLQALADPLTDLGLAYTPRDWPLDFARHALDFLSGRVPDGRTLSVHAVDVDLRQSFGTGAEEVVVSGRLQDFREWEVTGRTEVLGDIAQHACAYAKEGVQDGTPFTGRGHKTFQFVRTPAGWRISAVAWHDA